MVFLIRNLSRLSNKSPLENDQRGSFVMTEEIATHGDGSSQVDGLTIYITRKLLNLFQDKLKERNEDANSVLVKFIEQYAGKRHTL